MEEEIVLIKKEKRKKKIWPLICVILIIILVSGGGYYYYTNYYEKDKIVNNDEEDKKPSLKDDFYGNINYYTVKNAKLPNDSGAWDKFYDAYKLIQKRQEELTNEILADPDYKNEKIDIMVELYKDNEGRNKRGLSELQPYFDMIDKAKSIEEFNNVIMTLDEDLDLAVLVEYESINDFYDSTKKVLFIDQINIAGIPFEAFTEKKYAPIIPIIEKVFMKYFEAIGYSNDKSVDLIKKMEEFAKEIQAKSIKQSDITDLFELYKKYTLTEINEKIKNIPIQKLLSNLKIDKEEFYLVPDMGHYQALDEYYTIDHLPLIKEIAKIQIIDNFFDITTKDNEKFLLEISNEMNGTSLTMEEAEKNTIMSIKSSYIMDELQKRYEEKYFKAEDKKVVIDLVEEIRKYYKDVINKCNWLSPDTKNEAIIKLDNISINVGYQEDDKKKEDVFNPISKAKGGTLISNEIASNRLLFKTFHENFDKEASLSRLSTLEVNAYYQPQDNSINFLAGFKELYGNETDYYKLLGYFGTVIGHEISHAFDNNGSKYDENGKVRDWWTEEDKNNYDKLTKKIEEYYNNYEHMGFKVDGKKTLAENIADLASMKAMISIAESKGATNDDFKKMFEAYADLWVIKENKEYIQNQSLGDTHAANKVRVNAVLSSMDKFYEVYDIKEGDKMFVSKENRVGLW